jgi:hypothetical protein
MLVLTWGEKYVPHLGAKGFLNFSLAPHANKVHEHKSNSDKYLIK